LQNGKGGGDKKIEGLDKDKESLDVEDYSLHEALNLLKGISIMKK
jgi:carboxyl-terminal processing protease